MEIKDNKTTITGSNNTVNNNNIVNHISSSGVSNKTEPNWFLRLIIGGVITLIISVFGYYIKSNMDAKGRSAGQIQSHPPVKPN